MKGSIALPVAMTAMAVACGGSTDRANVATRANQNSVASKRPVVNSIAGLERKSSMIWPQARGYQRMVYAPSVYRILMSGGEAYASWGLGLPGLGGVWSFDAGTRRWGVVADTNPRYMDCVAYDTGADRLIAWVSFIVTGPGFFDLEMAAETWAFDPHTGVWENRHPTTSPPAGNLCGGAQMAYASRSRKAILFGGLDLVLLFKYVETGDESLLPLLLRNETWAYDFDQNTWTNMAPTVAPEARNSHGLTYDAQADRVILFGGGDVFVDFSGTWAYDYGKNAWAERKPANEPSARAYTSLAYDRETGVTVLFGGVDYFESTQGGDETWTYNFKENDWTLKHPPLAPSARGWHDMAYSEHANAVVLFGGGSDRDHFTDENWMYRTDSDRWVQIAKP